MARLKKTRVGSEYRVRGKDGQLKGEYNSPKKATEKAVKVVKKK